MKIAVLFDNFGPYHLARLNSAAEMNDVLGIEFASESGEYAWRRDARSDRFKRRTLFTEGPSDQCSTFQLRRQLTSALTEFQPEVVAVPGWSGRLAFAALAWCMKHKVPAIAMSESTETDDRRAAWKESLKTRCVAACSAALVGGRRHADYLVKLGMPADRISFGYDAVDNEHFARGAAAARQQARILREKLRLPSQYFLASSRFVEKKNLHNLIRAFAAYRVQVSSSGAAAAWDLVVLGDGPLRPELEQLTAELAVDQHVHMPGFKQYDELPAYFGMAGAFIHASTVEQWGLVVNEAMASGLPVLVSRHCGCYPDLIAEGENGFGLDPSSTDDMAARMQTLASLPQSQLDAMGRSSESKIQDFGPQQFANGLREASEMAVADRSTRRGSPLLMAALLKVAH